MKELKGYDKYILQWMIEHGHSLDKLINELQGTWILLNNEKEENEVIDIGQAFEVWYDSIGFNGEIFACKDEWENNEIFEKNDIINNVIADLEWSLDIIKKHGNISDDCLTEDEIKLIDIENDIEYLKDVFL